MSIIPLIAIVVVLLGVVLILRLVTRGNRSGKFATSSGKHYSYRLRKSFLSPAEARFFAVLQSAIPAGFHIFPQVRLADIFSVTGEDRSASTTGRNQITSKHIDFLLCAGPMTPVLGIELDDRSHDKEDRRKRDIFVEQVFAQAGLPLFRVKVQRDYDIESIKNAIQERFRQH